MAVYKSSDTLAYGRVSGLGFSDSTVTFIRSYAITTAMIDNANDELELCWVPAGAVITGIEFRCTDMDSNGSPTLKWDVGDDSDEDRLIAATTVGQSASTTATLEATGFGYKYSTATKIKAYVNTAATTAVAGTMYFRLTYKVDPNFTLAATVS